LRVSILGLASAKTSLADKHDFGASFVAYALMKAGVRRLLAGVFTVHLLSE